MKNRMSKKTMRFLKKYTLPPNTGSPVALPFCRSTLQKCPSLKPLDDQIRKQKQDKLDNDLSRRRDILPNLIHRIHQTEYDRHCQYDGSQYERIFDLCCPLDHPLTCHRENQQQSKPQKSNCQDHRVSIICHAPVSRRRDSNRIISSGNTCPSGITKNWFSLQRNAELINARTVSRATRIFEGDQNSVNLFVGRYGKARKRSDVHNTPIVRKDPSMRPLWTFCRRTRCTAPTANRCGKP